MPKIDQATYLLGLDHYRRGDTVLNLCKLADQTEEDASRALDEYRSRASGGTPEEEAKREALHNARCTAGPSLMTGFLDGLVADIRALRGRGQRA